MNKTRTIVLSFSLSFLFRDQAFFFLQWKTERQIAGYVLPRFKPFQHCVTNNAIHKGCSRNTSKSFLLHLSTFAQGWVIYRQAKWWMMLVDRMVDRILINYTASSEMFWSSKFCCYENIFLLRIILNNYGNPRYTFVAPRAISDLFTKQTRTKYMLFAVHKFTYMLKVFYANEISAKFSLRGYWHVKASGKRRQTS